MTTHTSRLAALALAGVALAGGGAATAGSASAAPSMTSTVSVPPAGSTAFGWTAAIRHVSGLHDGKGTVVLVDPWGTSMTTIGSVSDDAWLADVSYDGRKILTARDQEGEGLRVTVWDTATKTATYFRVAGIERGAQLAFGGDGILLKPGGGAIQSRTLTGAYVRSYAAKANFFTSSPNGAVIYEVTPTTIYARNAKTGGIGAARPVPAPYYNQEWACSVGQHWDSTGIALNCNGGGLGMEQTLRFELSTGAVSALSPKNSANAFPTAPRRVAEVGGNCSSVGYVDSAGFHDLPGMPRQMDDNSTNVSGAFGSTAWVENSSCMTDAPSHWFLGKYDLKTSTLSRLAGAGSRTGGLITQAQTIDGHH